MMLNIPHMLGQGDIDIILELTPPNARVVELGCWLGGSTLCFLEKTPHVHSVDKFIWQQYMEKKCPGVYGLGDTFLGAWLVNTQQQARYTGGGVERYSEREPIDVLYVDAWKHPTIMENSFKNVVPYLHRGSLILDQDYYFCPQAYMYAHLWYYRNRTHLDRIGRNGNTQAFRVLDCGFDYDTGFGSFSELADALDWANE